MRITAHKTSLLWLAGLFLLCAGAPLPAQAAASDSLVRWQGEVQVSPARALATDEYVKRWLEKRRSLSLDARLMHVTLPADSDAFARDFGYPQMGVGLKLGLNDVTMHRSGDWGQAENVPYTSHLGNTITLYGLFQRPWLRLRHFSFDYSLAFGFTYCRKKYDKTDNIDDELIGTHINIYCNLGTHATWYFAPQWGLRAGVEFFHHSNGALNRPNKGANFFGPVVGLAYEPQREVLLGARSRHLPAPFRPYWYLNFALGVGAKTLDEDWQKTQFNTPKDAPDYRTEHFRLYAAYALQADVMRRYARRWASGMGVDLFYGSHAPHIRALDAAAGSRERVSPWSVGVAAKHEVYYHNLSLAMSFGLYLYRQMGVSAKALEQSYYERIGIHYALPSLRGLTVGVNVKAHRTKADFTEVVLALPVRL